MAKQQKHWWAYWFDTGSWYMNLRGIPVLCRDEKGARYHFGTCFNGKIVKVKIVELDDDQG